MNHYFKRVREVMDDGDGIVAGVGLAVSLVFVGVAVVLVLGNPS